MKKTFLLLSLITIVAISSCNCPYGRYDDYGYEERYDSYGVTYSSDKFYADKLLGLWDCYYPMIVNLPEFGTVELKSMDFKNGEIVDIELVPLHNTDRRVYTFSYLYRGGYITFNRNGSTISFKIRNYIYPELFLQDSFGTYTIKKCKSYGC